MGLFDRFASKLTSRTALLLAADSGNAIVRTSSPARLGP
jgi:hypothetical protein